MSVEIRNQQKLIKINQQQLRKDSELLLTLLGLKNVEVSILITNDKRIKTLNFMYRNKNKSTDVLAFPQYDSLPKQTSEEEILLGDIVLNAHMAQRWAHDSGQTLLQVTRQLLIHAFLHLIGYDHKKNPSQARRMLKKEKQLSDALAQMD